MEKYVEGKWTQVQPQDRFKLNKPDAQVLHSQLHSQTVLSNHSGIYDCNFLMLLTKQLERTESYTSMEGDTSIALSHIMWHPTFLSCSSGWLFITSLWTHDAVSNTHTIASDGTKFLRSWTLSLLPLLQIVGVRVIEHDNWFQFWVSTF